MYRIYAGNETLHNPYRADEGIVVINPILSEKLNTHGSLSFTVAPSHPLYDEIEPRKTLIKVVSDTKNARPWFGRVMSVDMRFDMCLDVYCEGELGCLCDCIYQPFGFTGSPSQLFGRLFLHYYRLNIGANGYDLRPGNVTVVDPGDPNNRIVRSSKDPKDLWSLLSDALFGSSLGGYVVPRYDEENDVHYVDYLSDFDVTSTQTVEFGKNLLTFAKRNNAQDVITCLYPYGAELPDTDPDYAPDPPADGAWNGNRLTIESVNQGSRDIQNDDGVDMWGYIYGYRIWDDVTVASNLKSKAEAWLAQQIWSSVTLEISAVDLSFVNADISQIQVGEYVRVKSKPHDLNILLLCTEKKTYLTQLEKSVILLGAGMQTITDLQTKEKEDL